MRILISGSTGFIGSALFAAFSQKGHAVFRLVRDQKKPGVFFSFTNPEPCFSNLEGFDLIVHLCGANIAAERWTKKRKDLLRTSRIGTTKTLVQAIESLQHPPKHFLCASGLSYFGSQGDTPLCEDSLAGTGFLADLCKEWELCAKTDVCMVTSLRFGMVLGEYGQKSALDKMIPVAKKNGSAILGTGEQYISWIHIKDAIESIHWIIRYRLQGSVNICAPSAITQEEFANTLAKTLKKSRFLRIPSRLLSWIIGQLANELLLTSVKAVPEKLLTTGFSFQYPTFTTALKNLLIKSTKNKAV